MDQKQIFERMEVFWYSHTVKPSSYHLNINFCDRLLIGQYGHFLDQNSERWSFRGKNEGLCLCHPWHSWQIHVWENHLNSCNLWYVVTSCLQKVVGYPCLAFVRPHIRGTRLEYKFSHTYRSKHAEGSKGFQYFTIQLVLGSNFLLSKYRLFAVRLLQGLEIFFENIFVAKFCAVIKFAYYYTLFTAANFRQAWLVYNLERSCCPRREFFSPNRS